MKSISGEGLRYLIVGGLNTLLTYALYLALLSVASYVVAYSIAYVAGILSAYYLNSRFVFRAEMSLAKVLKFPAVYIVQYVLGVGLLHLLVVTAGMDEKIAPLLVIAITVPATFILSRLIILRRQST